MKCFDNFIIDLVWCNQQAPDWLLDLSEGWYQIKRLSVHLCWQEGGQTSAWVTGTLRLPWSLLCSQAHCVCTRITKEKDWLIHTRRVMLCSWNLVIPLRQMRVGHDKQKDLNLCAQCHKYPCVFSSNFFVFDYLILLFQYPWLTKLFNTAHKSMNIHTWDQFFIHTAWIYKYMACSSAHWEDVPS